MKISYNWLKWYIPDAPAPENLVDIITYHLCEVDGTEAKGDDVILDLKILPDRAHDLLSHQGVARELASLLKIRYVDPTEKYKIPHSTSSGQAPLRIEVENDPVKDGASKCRRYMGRIVRGVKVGPSPDWVVKHLESIGQRSINNMVDASNIVMFDCGQPTHVFDLKKVKEKLVIRQAKDGEMLTTLDNKECKLTSKDMVIADTERPLAIAGVKGGKVAEVDGDTVDVILEVANFDPTSVRKTAQRLNIFTDARKRFENDLSPELAEYAMRELSATILEMCPEATFEDIVDVYGAKPAERKLKFSLEKISKILGIDLAVADVEDILKAYVYEYVYADGVFEIVVPPMRFDLVIEEDMAEEIGRVLGYDKVKAQQPKIDFKPSQNETFQKISQARNKLLHAGYSEVMTYVFRDKGSVSVLASASDKKYLRANLSDGLNESLKLNKTNMPLLGLSEIKIFEIGTVWTPAEEIHVAYNEKNNIVEKTLEEFTASVEKNFSDLLQSSTGTLSAQAGFRLQNSSPCFAPWSLFPFISRDVSVWIPNEVESDQVCKVIKENAGELLVKDPYIFDKFTKGDQTSYAFRMVFQSFDRTLTDAEVNEIVSKITNKINEKNGWQVR